MTYYQSNTVVFCCFFVSFVTTPVLHNVIFALFFTLEPGYFTCCLSKFHDVSILPCEQ